MIFIVCTGYKKRLKILEVMLLVKLFRFAMQVHVLFYFASTH